MVGNALLAQACLAEVGMAKEQTWWGCVVSSYYLVVTPFPLLIFCDPLKHFLLRKYF